MPEAGTKQMELDGRKVFLPAGDVELEELVREGIAAQLDVEAAKARLDAVKERIAHIAGDRRHGRKTVRLDAPRAGTAVVTFAQETRLDEDRVRELERALPPAIFYAVFAARTTYSLTKGYRVFMRTPQAHDLEHLKTRVAAALDVRPKKPQVKFLPEGSATEPEIDDEQ